MTGRPHDVTTVYIAAVGGQGGALLCDWLLAAANQMRFKAHSVGIPGMSQRGGATSYYVEMAPEKTAPGLADALLSPAPFFGEIDCLIGLELLELGRAAESGYCSEKTSVVGSTHRDYTILEKLPSYEGPAAEDKILALLGKLSRRLVAFDALALARVEGLSERQVNAVLLGAVAASSTLPLKEEAYRLAIKAVGVAPDLNLKAFEAGLGHTLAGAPDLEVEEDSRNWRSLEFLSDKQKHTHRSLMEALPSQVNGELSSMLEVAFARLIEYQDEAYARRFLDRVLSLWRKDQDHREDFRLTIAYARHLANLMTYEDPVRVASLKSDPRRFGQIEAEHGVQEDQTYRLTERFQPEAEELYGLLPAGLVRLFRGPGEKHDARGGVASSQRSVPVRVKTTSVGGMAVLKVMASLKALRARSWRREREELFQEFYTRQVLEMLSKSYELAWLAAEAGGLIRGYGRVRRRTERLFHTYVGEFLKPLAALDERLAPSGDGYRLTLRAAEAVRGKLKPTGAGFEEAVALAVNLQSQGESYSYEGLIEVVSGFSRSSGQGPSSSSHCSE
jgi:indolepyruvate ferredoxin oxidoreductase beta subunit